MNDELSDQQTRDETSTDDSTGRDEEFGLIGLVVRFSWIVVAQLVVIAALVTMFTWFASVNWIADLLANLRVQQVIAITLLMIATVGFRRWRWTFACFIMLAIHLPWFAPALPWQQDTPTGRPELVVMVANVLTSNPHHDLVLKQIRLSDPDVFAILELGTPLNDRLESELGKSYPYRVTHPRDNSNFGIGIYSRLELRDVERIELNVDGVQTLAATVTQNEQDYRIVATHPLPPMGPKNFKLRNEHLDQLLTHLTEDRTGDPNDAVVLMGDMNLTPWSPHFSVFDSIAGLRRAGNGHGLVPTWHAVNAFPFGLQLDHVFISKDLQCESHEIGDNNGSDHRPVTVSVSHRP